MWEVQVWNVNFTTLDPGFPQEFRKRKILDFESLICHCSLVIIFLRRGNWGQITTFTA